MIKKIMSILVLLTFLFSCAQQSHLSAGADLLADGAAGSSRAVASKPFPQNIDNPNTIKPSHKNASQLASDVQAYYQYWKTKYMKESNGNTPGGGYYVKADSTGGHNYPIKSNSEAHGYGMMIFALMGDKTYFDGMYNMYDKHRSKTNQHNMSWVITQDEYAWQDSNSATDGDMDIAYSLLLAHEQWGSGGTVNYLAEAKRIINLGLKPSDMNVGTKRVMLGDWDKNQYSTRSSDWLASHFRAYAAATGDSFWLQATDEIYSLVSHFNANYSSATGLMPDFIVDANARPANPHFLEGPNDGSYYYNACRFPWRISMDYANYGTPEAKVAVSKVLDWLMVKTGGEPTQIKAGYTLDGNVLSGSNYYTGAFAAPFVAAAVVDPAYQTFLNKGWDSINGLRETYYEDTLNLLCQIFISGNWWQPGVNPKPVLSLNLSASSTTVEEGQNVTLNWSSNNAVTVTASNGWTGSKALSGSETINSLQADTTFTLTAVDKDGKSVTKTVTVKVVKPVMEVTFTASVDSVEKGKSVTLTWSSRNAAALNASGGWSGSKALSGSEVISNLQADTTFTLTAVDSSGLQITKSITVTVIELNGVEVIIEDTSNWGTGFSGKVTIKNGSNKPLSSWKIVTDLDFEIASAWSCRMTRSGNTYTLSDAGWNGTIGVGQTVTFGFGGKGNVTPTSASNSSFNGNPIKITTIKR